MGRDDEYFRPEKVDEQIDQLIEDPQLTMSQVLHDLYKDDARRLEQVWDRLAAYARNGESIQQPLDIQDYQQRKVQNGQYDVVPSQARPHATHTQRLALLLTQLVAVLVIASILVVPMLIAHPSTSPHTVTPPDLYLSNSQGVMRVDARTQKVYWQYHIADYALGNSPISPIVASNNIVYAESQDSIYAIDATAGMLLWSHQLLSQISPYPTNKARLVLSGNTLYVSVVTNDVYAFNATDGTLLHTYTLHLNTAVVAIAVENNVLYANGFFDMCEINLIDGKQLWYKESDPSLTLGIPHIMSGVIYSISSTDSSWPSQQADSENISYVNAYSVRTGDLLWQSANIPGTITDITVSNNVVYAGATNGAVSAYTARNGTLLWSKVIPGMSFSGAAPVVEAGFVYLDAKSAADHYNPMGIIALDALNGEVKWEYPGGLQAMMRAGYSFEPPVVQYGVVYVSDQTSSELYAIEDGDVLWHIQITS